MQLSTTSHRTDDCRATRRRKPHDRLGLASSFAYVAVITPTERGVTHVSAEVSTSAFGLRFIADGRRRVYVGESCLDDESILNSWNWVAVNHEDENVFVSNDDDHLQFLGKIAAFSSLVAAETWLAKQPKHVRV